MLSQRYLFISKTYIISEKGLVVQSRSIGKFSEQTVPYEAISFNTSKVYETNGQFILVSLVAAFLSFVGFMAYQSSGSGTSLFFVSIFPILAIVFGYLAVVSRRKFINIDLISDTPLFIALIEDSPDEEEVDKFISDLFNSIRKYMKEKYIDPILPVDEQILRLRSLYERNIIDKDEYEALTVKAKYNY